MKLSQEESRGLAFIGAMILLSILGRWADRPQPLRGDVAAINLDSLEAAAEAASKTKAKPTAKPRSKPAAKPKTPKQPVAGSGSQRSSGGPAAGRAAAGPSGRSTSGTSTRATTSSQSQQVAERSFVPASAGRAAQATNTHHATGGMVATGGMLAGSVTTAGRVGPASQPDASARRKPAAAGAVTPVSINTATAEELDALPGIGPVLARRIVAYRDSVGRFPNVEALLGVKGVGPAMLERLRPHVRAP